MVTEIVLDLGGKGVGWLGRNRYSSINLHGSWYRGAELQEFFKLIPNLQHQISLFGLILPTPQKIKKCGLDIEH